MKHLHSNGNKLEKILRRNRKKEPPRRVNLSAKKFSKKGVAEISESVVLCRP